MKCLVVEGTVRRCPSNIVESSQCSDGYCTVCTVMHPIQGYLIHLLKCFLFSVLTDKCFGTVDGYCNKGPKENNRSLPSYFPLQSRHSRSLEGDGTPQGFLGLNICSLNLQNCQRNLQ